MKEIIIDEEFKSLLPALDKETYARLEGNLLLHGCRDSIVLWNDIIIDGHNRYAICAKNGIPFKTIDMEFGCREEALIWIINTQVSRRNLTPIQMSHFRGLHYRAIKKLQGYNPHETIMSQNGTLLGSTKSQLADQYKVSKNTIIRDAKLSESIDAVGAVSPEAKRQILAGEISINKNTLGGISTLPLEDVENFANKIESGAYDKKAKTETIPVNNSYLDALKRFETEITKITEKLFFNLRKRAKKDEPIKLKPSLRMYIDMLEKLYDRI